MISTTILKEGKIINVCSFCGKNTIHTSSGYYVCSCEEAQEEYKKNILEQSKNEILFFGFKNEEEVKLYFDIDLIKKDWKKEKCQHITYFNKKLKMRVAWYER